jgi:hypothetical protein
MFVFLLDLTLDFLWWRIIFGIWLWGNNNLNRFYWSVFIHVYKKYFHSVYNLYLVFSLPPCWYLSSTDLVLHSGHSVLRTRFCYERKTTINFLSLSGLFPLTWWAPVTSIFLQMNNFILLYLLTVLYSEYILHYLYTFISGWALRLIVHFKLLNLISSYPLTLVLLCIKCVLI